MPSRTAWKSLGTLDGVASRAVCGFGENRPAGIGLANREEVWPALGTHRGGGPSIRRCAMSGPVSTRTGSISLLAESLHVLWVSAQVAWSINDGANHASRIKCVIERLPSLTVHAPWQLLPRRRARRSATKTTESQSPRMGPSSRRKVCLPPNAKAQQRRGLLER